MWLTCYCYWTAGFSQGQWKWFAESRLYFLPPLHSHGLPLVEPGSLHTRARGGPTVKCLLTTNTCCLVNSETVQGRWMALVQLPQSSSPPARLGPAPEARLPLCAPRPDPACSPGQHSGTRQAGACLKHSLSCLGTVFRQVRFKAPHM